MPGQGVSELQALLILESEPGARSAALVCTSALGNTDELPFDGVPSHRSSFRAMCSCSYMGSRSQHKQTDSLWHSIRRKTTDY